MITTLSKEFIDQSIFRINESTKRIQKCFGEVEEPDIWKSANDNSNSIGNLVLHLCGNIRQYIISSLGKKPDTRERAKEFSAENGFTKAELLKKLTETVYEATEVVKKCDEAELLKVYSVQGFDLPGIGIIIHVTEHFSYHTGQIAFWTKQLINKDLGFYANIDLNIKNKN